MICIQYAPYSMLFLDEFSSKTVSSSCLGASKRYELGQLKWTVLGIQVDAQNYLKETICAKNGYKINSEGPQKRNFTVF